MEEKMSDGMRMGDSAVEEVSPLSLSRSSLFGPVGSKLGHTLPPSVLSLKVSVTTRRASHPQLERKQTISREH
jgi:hypothetical protein